MSITVKNSVAMSKSQLNKSPSKQTYSFPRQGRFEEEMQGSYCDALYYLPSTKSQRSAGIGYGGRSKENSSLKSVPGPNHYEQKVNTTLSELEKKKGWTMGVSRERMEQASNSKSKSPGPGTFIPKSTLSKVAFTMRGKGKIAELEQGKNEPGPGHYTNLPKLNPLGKYQLSSMKNVHSTIFSPSIRFQKDHSNVKNPGPGQYNNHQNTGLSPVGNYFLSNLANSNCRTFNKAIGRMQISNEHCNIGPGSYILPSDFGIYRSQKENV